MHEVLPALDQKLIKALANSDIPKQGNIIIQAEELSALANKEIVIFNPEITGL